MRYLLILLTASILLSGCGGPRVSSAACGELPTHFSVKVNLDITHGRNAPAIASAAARAAMQRGYVITTETNPVLLVNLSGFEYGNERPTTVVASANLFDNGRMVWSGTVTDACTSLYIPGQFLDDTIAAMILALPPNTKGACP